jgi:hypothetical protein
MLSSPSFTVCTKTKTRTKTNTNTLRRYSVLFKKFQILIEINQPTRCNSSTSLLLDVYVWQNMFGASTRPSSGAYNYTRSLWFYRWSEAAGALLVVVWQVIGSTCLERLPVHHQEHAIALGTSGFAVGLKRLERCCSWSGRLSAQHVSGVSPPIIRSIQLH